MAVTFNPFTGQFDFTGGASPVQDLDASSNPNYPAASKGDRYRITVAGRVGGVAGKIVEAGDTIEALVSNAGGTEAAVGTDWFAMQANIAGITAAGLGIIQAADAPAQRTLLGLGTMASQNASAIAVTGGTVSGLSYLGLINQGTGNFNVVLLHLGTLSADRQLNINVGNADRTFTLSGNPTLSGITTTGTGTLALGAFVLTVPATGTAALLGVAQSFSAANIFSVAGVVSTPAVSITGAIFTGGSATSTKPLFLVEPAGTTSNGWSTGGTLFGVNAPSGSTSDLFWFGKNGSTKAKLFATDAVYGILGTTTLVVRDDSGFGMGMGGGILSTDRSDGLYLQYAGTKAIWLCNATSKIGDKLMNFNEDVGIARTSAANLKVTNGSSGYGTLDAAGFKVAGVAGANFGPGLPTSMTIVNGLVTAAS